jgi:hypothetical protein
MQDTINTAEADDGDDPIGFWIKERRWPSGYGIPEMVHSLAWKQSLPSISRKRSNSASSATPSDERLRTDKAAPYRDSRYETLLNTKGVYMEASELGIADNSERAYQGLLQATPEIPQGTIFDDAVFEQACKSIQKANEARVIHVISRLIVPSAEIFSLSTKRLRILIESVKEGWNNSIPLTGTRPRPDYSVGFRREAFSEAQLIKLSPFVGEFLVSDQSLFMATHYMFFPFLSCEVKCGAAALDIADLQNTHSMTLAARGVVELFRLVKREDEVSRQILSFSVSHDRQSVRIHGYYPVIDGKDTKYYRHTIRKYDFTELNGREKWTAYSFVKSIYDLWVPEHFQRICSAIDQLPSEIDFDVPTLQVDRPLSELGKP